MAEKLDLQFTFEESSGDLVTDLQVHDLDLLGHEARFEIVAKVDVHDSRAINADKVLHSQTFAVARQQQLRVPRHRIDAYTYRGRMIDLEIHTRVIVDDSILFDTKVSEEQELALALKPTVAGDADKIVEPGDDFFFFSNLQAIPAKNRAITLGLLVAGAAVVLVNMLLGVHDQFVPEAQAYFYDHRDSDGDSESPLVKALMGSGALGVGVWLAIRKQLRKYAELRLRPLPERIRSGDLVTAGQLFEGRARVALEDVTLRIVASNMECGQYRRGSGTDERTVSFREPARGVVLYEKEVRRIPARTPIEASFQEAVSFDPMFDVLYPECMITTSHGIGIYWEIQLLHPRFIDHELTPSTSCFRREDFL